MQVDAGDGKQWRKEQERMIGCSVLEGEITQDLSFMKLSSRHAPGVCFEGTSRLFN